MRKPHTEEHKQSLRKPKCYMPLKGPRSQETKQKIGLANSKPKPKGFGESHSIKMTGKISPKKGIGKPILQFTQDGLFVKEWESAMEIANFLSKRANLIYDCCLGKVKTAYGFKWEFKKD